MILRLCPASHAAEVAPHIIARGGWVATGLAAEICAEALGRPQTLALCDDGLPAASADDVDLIRRAFADAAAGPDDLGARQAQLWLDLINASRWSGQRPAWASVVYLDAPAPVRPAEPRSELAARAALLDWRRSGGAV